VFGVQQHLLLELLLELRVVDFVVLLLNGVLVRYLELDQVDAVLGGVQEVDELLAGDHHQQSAYKRAHLAVQQQVDHLFVEFAFTAADVQVLHLVGEVLEPVEFD